MRATRGVQKWSWAALASALASGSCQAPRQEAGGDCLFNDECRSPLVCSGRRCRLPCADRRDCQLLEQCERPEPEAVRVCLPEVYTRACGAGLPACPSGQVCAVDGRCRPECATSVDCPLGQVCSAQGRCGVPDAGGAEASVLDVVREGGAEGGVEAGPEATPEAATGAEPAPDVVADAGMDAGMDAPAEASPEAGGAEAGREAGDAAALRSVRSVAPGALCATLEDDSAWCWGSADYEVLSSLGDGGTVTALVPAPVRDDADPTRHLQGVRQLVRAKNGPSLAGSWVWDFACALLRGGTVRCWGANESGQLGQGSASMTPQGQPAAVPGLTGVTQLAAGIGFACALGSDGLLRCWGANDSGQLGLPVAPFLASPTVVPGLTGVRAVSAGSTGWCAQVGASEVRCTGGLFGAAPTAVQGLEDVVSVRGLSLSGYIACAAVTWNAATEAGTTAIDGVRCWSLLASGGIGNLTLGNPSARADGRAYSVLVPLSAAPYSEPLGQVLEVSAGNSASCARQSSGQVWCWGTTSYGLLGNTVSRVTSSNGSPYALRATALGAVTALAPSFDDEHLCWTRQRSATDPVQLYCIGFGPALGIGLEAAGPVVAPTRPVGF